MPLRSHTASSMRQLKFHEQKLLKKAEISSKSSLNHE